MADNVGYTPGSGATISTDEIAGAHHQRVKLTLGNDSVDNGTVSATNPMPIAAYSPIPIYSNGAPLNTRALQTDDLLVMLSRIVKLLESNAVVDSAQRQRVTIDAGTLPLVTTVSTVSAVTQVSTVLSMTNAVAIAGMDREQYINIAKQTYTQSIRNRLEYL